MVTALLVEPETGGRAGASIHPNPPAFIRLRSSPYLFRPGVSPMNLRRVAFPGVVLTLTVFTLLGALAQPPRTGAVAAGEWPQWRGPDRTGVSRETGLLKSWAQGSPR